MTHSSRLPAVQHPGASRRAFTLVEAMVAITLAAIAGSALLMSTTSSLDSTSAAMHQTIALGMAQQLMDEVVGNRYCEAGGSAHDTVLQPGSSERVGNTRQRFDDIDDFNGYRSQPPTDAWGIALGKDNGEGGERHPAFQAPSSFLANWRQEVRVYYVSADDPSRALGSGQVSDYRAVEVRIVEQDPDRGSRELARLRRVVIYVPPLYE